MQDKKEAVLGKPKDKNQSSSKMIAALIVALVVAAGGAFYFLTSGEEETGGAVATDNTGGSPSGGQVIRLEAAQFDDGKAKHFVYKVTEELQIKFFVLKSSDGVIRAAFDACDVCWRAGKGYAQEGDKMVCINCGLRFASTKINEVKGGCNPSPLNRMVKNGHVVIQVADILEGKRYFNFKQG